MGFPLGKLVNKCVPIILKTTFSGDIESQANFGLTCCAIINDFFCIYISCSDQQNDGEAKKIAPTVRLPLKQDRRLFIFVKFLKITFYEHNIDFIPLLLYSLRQ